MLSGSNSSLTCEVVGISTEPEDIVWIVDGTEYDVDSVSDTYKVGSNHGNHGNHGNHDNQ